MFKRFLLILVVSLSILQWMPSSTVAVANAASIIPTVDTGNDVPKNCIDLINKLQQDPHAGDWLATKVKCGRMGLEDVIYYARYMLGFFFNILGTLGVLSIIRAGYLYIINQGKDNKKAQTAIKNAVIGIIVAFSSFTIARVVFSFLQTST